LNISVVLIYGQFNPIKNLQFGNFYQTPYNCYSLSWSPPDTSLVDTLIGYNIFRDDSLYSFTTSTSHSCYPCIGDTNSSFCDFMMYNDGLFYMHVTAVYNSSMTESLYNDSVYFGGIVIGLNEMKNKFSVSVSPNPFSTETILQTNQNFKNASLIMYNSLGLEVRQLRNINEHNITIFRENLPCGLYFIRLTENNKTIAMEKVVIIDN
jgi:hypothetical protein